MMAVRDEPAARRWPDVLRWGICAMLALSFHAAGAAALLARWNDSAELGPKAPVILIDIAPVAAAPRTAPAQLPPDKTESKPRIAPQPAPDKPVDIARIEPAPEPAHEPELTIRPPPKPIVRPPEKPKQVTRKPPRRKASLASQPSAADTKAARPAAPKPGRSAYNAAALTDWHAALLARFKRYTRYPPDALARDRRATVYLAFRVDRRGGVHRARITRSSGSDIFDRATLAMIARAAPLPPPPPDVADSELNIEIPIRYNRR